MTEGNWGSNTTQWLRGTGPDSKVVISSRIRLARNLAGLPFLTKCTSDHQLELEHRLANEIQDSGVLGGSGMYIDIAAADPMDRELLVERHLISRHHADAGHPRGLAVSSDETIAIMTNEEDHIRIQVLRGGLQLDDALSQINTIDDRLDERLDFAFHSRFGYLTACPTNVGTGLRVSVMLHLPALRLAGELEKVFHAAADMHLAIRGLYGEGTAAYGDFFQLSNQTTLGRTEADTVAQFSEEILPAFIDYELTARVGLAQRDRMKLDDLIFRALATLQNARLMGPEEMMHLLSLVRLGVNMGRIDGVSLETINDMFLLGQPAHLQRALQRQMDTPQLTGARATFIRHRLGGNG